MEVEVLVHAVFEAHTSTCFCSACGLQQAALGLGPVGHSLRRWCSPLYVLCACTCCALTAVAGLCVCVSTCIVRGNKLLVSWHLSFVTLQLHPAIDSWRQTTKCFG